MNMEKRDKYRSLWLRVGYAVVRDGHISNLGVRAFAIFMIIRTYSNQKNIAFPSLHRIAKLSGCTVRTVQKEIDKLERLGWLKKEKVRGLNGQYKRNHYQILENRLIRGTDQPSFIDYPVEDISIGLGSTIGNDPNTVK